MFVLGALQHLGPSTQIGWHKVPKTILGMSLFETSCVLDSRDLALEVCFSRRGPRGSYTISHGNPGSKRMIFEQPSVLVNGGGHAEDPHKAADGKNIGCRVPVHVQTLCLSGLQERLTVAPSTCCLCTQDSHHDYLQALGTCYSPLSNSTSTLGTGSGTRAMNIIPDFYVQLLCTHMYICGG